MTLRLILMRHAKSSWGDPRLSDHERPLNKRGRQSAVAIGDWMRSNDYLPEFVLCSTSERTRETFAKLKIGAPVDYIGALYHAESTMMMEVLRGATGQTVLMIGHNPGIAEFASRVVRSPVTHGRFFDFPTCATLVAEFPAKEWAAVEFSTATPIDFVVPRDLRNVSG